MSSVIRRHRSHVLKPIGHKSPKRSVAPVFWLLFGAGGMLSALFGPALIILTGFVIPRGWGLPANFGDFPICSPSHVIPSES